MSTVAQDIIIPKETGIFRTIFLYVGQGESTLLVIPDDEKYKFMLIDSNLDEKLDGIDLVKLLKDLIDTELDIFVNTHPHLDHINGIKKIYEEVGIGEIWHSGHIPGGDHKDNYEEFKSIIDEIEESDVYIMRGSSEENKLDDEGYTLGDINFNILAPAEYVSDEIEDEKPETRYQRIHEQCAVIRFSYGDDPGRILITGDSDLAAWKDHISEYHKANLPANILSASHHGSRTFFKDDENDSEYTDHIEYIKPSYLVVSAPKSEESKHDHPHADSLEIYKKYIDGDNVFHLGNYNDSRCCVIVDIYSDGSMKVDIDEELYNNYSYKKDDNGDKGKTAIKSAIPFITNIDNKPMGSNELV